MVATGEVNTHTGIAWQYLACECDPAAKPRSSAYMQLGRPLKAASRSAMILQAEISPIRNSSGPTRLPAQTSAVFRYSSEICDTQGLDNINKHEEQPPSFRIAISCRQQRYLAMHAGHVLAHPCAMEPMAYPVMGPCGPDRPVKYGREVLLARWEPDFLKRTSDQTCA